MELDVFADESDGGFLAEFADSLRKGDEVAEIRLVAFARKAEMFEDEIVDPLLVKVVRKIIDDGCVIAFEDALKRDVAEQGDLLFGVGVQGDFRTEDDGVGLKAQRGHLLDGMLSRLGFGLPRSLQIRNEGVVEEEGIVVAELEPGLADGFQEGLRFDVPHRSADLGDDDVGARGFRRIQKSLFDLIGHVGDDLDAGAEIIPAAFLFQNRAIDLARRDGGLLGEVDVEPPFVMA